MIHVKREYFIYYFYLFHWVRPISRVAPAHKTKWKRKNRAHWLCVKTVAMLHVDKMSHTVQSNNWDLLIHWLVMLQR